MTRPFALIPVALAVVFSANAFAQSANPTCQRLEAQLASLDRGNADPARADQIRRADGEVNRQQFEVDRLVAQSRRMGCESRGFFSLFSSQPAQCEPLDNQIRQARANLERTQMQLEGLNGGTTERAAQRRSLLVALGDNNCGPQYRAAAAQSGGFMEQLFGNNNVFSGQSGAAGTFRTICVRTCDGYYFPISFTAPSSKFGDDERTCQRMCPAADVALYTYRNPGEEVSQAVSLNGRAYSDLPTAFAYRKEFNPACSCRRPGQNWSDALKAGGADDTVMQGDIIVTEERAKRMSQPQRVDANGRPVRSDARNPQDATTATPAQGQTQGQAPAADEPAKGPVRTVGPQFLPAH